MNARTLPSGARKAPSILAYGAALMLVSSACSSSDNNGDGDGGGRGESFFSGSCPEGVDPAVNTDTALDLLPDTEVDDYICPIRDKDFYKITIPANQNLLRITLQHSNPISKIDLIYLVMKKGATPEQNVVVARSPSGKGNQFNALHCLEAGTYYIQVQDSGDDAADNSSQYRLSYKLDADQDGNERNDSADSATELTSGTSATGQISCTEDADYYVLRAVAANQLLKVALTTAEPTSVDYRYTVMRKVGEKLDPLMSGQNDDGSRELTDRSTIAAVPSAGDYWVKVEDVDNNDSDTLQPYQLVVEKLPELDANEDNEQRNDHPNDREHQLVATSLGTFDGTARTFASSGRIGSNGDVDYFVIGDSRGGGGNAAIEIELTFPDDTKVDPAVALIYPTAKVCTKDKCCNVIDLPADTSCVGPLSCVDSSFVCQDQGQAYCSDPECAGEGVSSTCASTRKCAGAVLCLKQSENPSGVCGAIQFFRPTFQEVQDGGTVRTGHPLKHAGPWYIRVSDQGGDEFDYDAAYQLRVVVAPEGDAFEYDNGYFPRLINSSNREPVVSAEGVDSLNVFFRKTASTTDLGAIIPVPPATGWGTSIKGYISYENDVDHFRFANPCHDNEAGAPDGLCMLQARYRAIGRDGTPGSASCPAVPDGPGSGLEFKFILTSRDTQAEIPGGTPAASTNWRTFGYEPGNDADGCQIMTRHIVGQATFSTGPTFDLEVFDAFRNNFSTSCGYELQFRVSYVGCAEPACKYDTNYAPGATVKSCYVR